MVARSSSHERLSAAVYVLLDSELKPPRSEEPAPPYVSLATLLRTLGRLAAAAIMLMSSAPAFASLQVALGNPGLAHFDSDGGVQLDFGLTDQNGQPVGNLTKDDVQVFEDGQPAKILYFRGVGQGRPVDIVFVLDITESMQPYIDAVKQNMINFAQDLEQNHRDYRLGLVTFEDYVVSAYPDCNCEYSKTMTSDAQKFTDWVGTLHAGGGGDIPEDQLDALAYAATLPFRPDAQGIIILITDAPPHVAGDGPDRTDLVCSRAAAVHRTAVSAGGSGYSRAAVQYRNRGKSLS